MMNPLWNRLPPWPPAARSPHHATGLALALAVACSAGEGRQSWEGAVDTLPTGTIVVRNAPQGSWDSGSTWRLMEDMRIGSVEGEDATTFSRIAALAVDAAGRVYVVDAQAQEVRVFDAEGRHVRTIGRKGGGPGEFAEADGIAVDQSGNLWVGDRRARRLSVFDSSGVLGGDYRRDGPGFVPWLTYGWPGGTLWDAWQVSGTDGKDGHTELLRFANGAFRDTLRLPPFEPPQWRIVSRQGITVNTFNFPVPLTAREVLALDPTGAVWRAISGEYRVTRFTATGDSTLIVLREYQPVAVTTSDRERVLARYRQTFSESGTPLDESLVPAFHPALHGMWVDDRGHLWVVPVSADTANMLVDVFDPTGRYLGAVRTSMTPRMLRPQPVVRDGRLYYVATDALDVPYVVRERIEGMD